MFGMLAGVIFVQLPRLLESKLGYSITSDATSLLVLSNEQPQKYTYQLTTGLRFHEGIWCLPDREGARLPSGNTEFAKSGLAEVILLAFAVWLSSESLRCVLNYKEVTSLLFLNLPVSTGV